MHIHKTAEEYKLWRKTLSADISLGFIPTMGALHEGHKALIETGVRENHFSVVSIFVNPIQFNSAQDLETYPVCLEADLALCRGAGVSAVFIPETAGMYDRNHLTYCEVEQLDKHLCGATRPGHFRGVCTVVMKLFNIVKPDIAYFGKKDFQQAVIIERMVKDLNIDVKILKIDTVREPSGLAISSRNQRLSEPEKKRAAAIYRGLKRAKEMFFKGELNSAVLIRAAEREINSSGPENIDYIQVVSQSNLQPLKKIGEPSLLAAAVFYGNTRLIDNVELNPLSASVSSA
jgi:pantoate--beta-alanine ligase